MRPSQRQLPSPALLAAGPFDELGKAPASALRNTEIVRAHAAGMTLAAIAAEHRLSRSRVQQVVSQAAQEEAERHRADGCTDAFEYLSRSVRHCLRHNGLSTVDEVRNACLVFADGAGLLRYARLGKLKLRQIRRWLLLQTGDPRHAGRMPSTRVSSLDLMAQYPFIGGASHHQPGRMLTAPRLA